jgi:hypothetical protein
LACACSSAKPVDLGAIHDSTNFNQEYQALPIELGIEEARTLQLGGYFDFRPGNPYSPGAQRFSGYWGEFQPHIHQAGEMASIMGVPALPPALSTTSSGKQKHLILY